MAETPSVIQHPAGYIWGAAVRTAARHRFKFSLGCESGFKALLKAGSKVTKLLFTSSPNVGPRPRATPKNWFAP